MATKKRTIKATGDIDARMIAESEWLTRLDGMLGLIDYPEMYTSVDLPVVAKLRTEHDSDYFVLSGYRAKSCYKVRGIWVGALSSDGFSGDLSLDGRLLKTTSDNRGFTSDVRLCDLEVPHSLRAELHRVSGTYHWPPDSDYRINRPAELAIEHLNNGKTLRDAVTSACLTFPTCSPSDVLRAISAWYRTHSWEEIRARSLTATQVQVVTEIPQVREAVKVLNREIGSLRAEFARFERMAEAS